MRLLVIEDEKRLAQNLAELLRRQGYTVDVSSDGVSGYDNASTDLYDLILLDAMLPGMDGFTLLRKLRAGGHAVPVLMLTARSDLSDRVQGLDCGADYYLTKPFEPEELLACVRSLLRRGGGDARTDDAITFGDLRLEPGTFQLSCGERSLRLSRREYDMLELLLRSQGRVVPKEQLLLKVWGYIAGQTPLPVIGIPIKASALEGIDALLSTVQMPAGVPVATVAIDGAANAAFLAVQILAVSDDALMEKMKAYRAAQTAKVLEADKKMEQVLAEL